MLISGPSADKYDAVSDFAAIASDQADIDAHARFPDHVQNLLRIRDILLARRRLFAQDAAAFPVVTMGRAGDIITVSRMINELEVIIEQEKQLASQPA